MGNVCISVMSSAGVTLNPRSADQGVVVHVAGGTSLQRAPSFRQLSLLSTILNM